MSESDAPAEPADAPAPTLGEAGTSAAAPGEAGTHSGETDGGAIALPLRTRLRWAITFLIIGMGAASYLHWPALTDRLEYKSDVRQAPHWAAYHTDTFREDDLLLRLAAHNESPIQNFIYYVGTYLVDMVLLGKLLAVLSYGLTAALFFWIGSSLLGLRGGALAAFFFTFCPDQFGFSAGGFSKAWMIPLILGGLYALERGSWRWLILLMPFGAAAYPVSAVMLGAMALALLLLEAPERGKRMLPALGALVVASALALGVLLIKYIFPPEGIGTLTSGKQLSQMREMFRGGMWAYLPLPTLTAEMTQHLSHPFILFSALVFLVCLGRERAGWTRPMTALLVASVVFYIIATLVFMNLYQPNRYTRYSMAVLLVIWHAWNWDRVLARIPWRPARIVVLLAVLALGLFLFRGTFEMGEDTSPRHEWAELNEFLATQPPRILVAGHPNYMDDVPILARRSVLCNYKLAHPWYSEFYPEMRRRTEATFDALYADSTGPVNRLAEEWGVTHLVVVKRYLSAQRVWDRNIYVKPYDDYLVSIVGSRFEFLLSQPPPESILFENDELFVLALPLPDH